MKKGLILFALCCLGAGLACSLSPLSGSPSQPTMAPGSAPIVEEVRSTATNPAAAASPSPQAGAAETESRSASIDLSQDSAITSTPDVPPTLAPQPQLPLLPAEWYPMSASAEANDQAVTILGWGIPGKEEKTQPEPGKKFIWVDAVLLNRGSAYFDFSPQIQAKLTGGAGTEFMLNNLHFLYEAENSGNYHIAPGEHLRREFYFSVPENAPPLTFEYQTCFACEPGIQIPLTKSPAGGEVPAELNAPDPGAHPLGEVITQSKRAFSANRWQVIPPAEQKANSNILPGMNVVKINLMIANLDQQPMTSDATSGVWISLKDKTGRYYQPASWVFNVSNLIEAGEWSQGHLSFQVPPRTEGLELVVDLIEPGKHWPDIMRTFISLGDQPALADAALAQMPGVVAPQPVALGTPREIGGFTVTAQEVSFPSASGCNEIPPGYRAVLVRASVMNSTGAAAETYHLREFLKDSQGNEYAPCLINTDAPTGLAADATANLEYNFIALDIPGDLFLVENILSDDSKIFFALK